MTSIKGGGPPVRGTAATKTLSSHHEAGHCDDTASARRAERTTASHLQYVISFDRSLTTAERFKAFHEANPQVGETLVALTREWVTRTGRRKVGIGMLYERARWEIAITTNDPDFKLNNDFRAYYARLIMRQHQDLAGVFELRRSEADQWLGEVAS